MTTQREIIGEGHYAVGAHQQFVDREGKLVRVIRGEGGKPQTIILGEAYAFFNCNASKEKIEAVIPQIRCLVQTPQELELKLSLLSQAGFFRGELEEIATEARNANIKYVLQAHYPSATNRKTADELSDILNQTYQSSIFEEGEPFIGEITFKEDGRFVYQA